MDFRPEATRNLLVNRNSSEQQNSMRYAPIYSSHGNGFKPPLYGESGRGMSGSANDVSSRCNGVSKTNYYLFGEDTRIPINNNSIAKAPTNLYNRHNVVDFSDRMSINTRNREHLQNKGTVNNYMQNYKQVQHPCQTNIVADDFLRPQNSKATTTSYFNRDTHIEDKTFVKTFNSNGMAGMPKPEEMNMPPQKKNDLYIVGKYIGNDPNLKKFSVMYKNNCTQE